MRHDKKYLKISIIIILLVLTLLASLGYLTRAKPIDYDSLSVAGNLTSFVKKSGKKFILNGGEFRFVGFNLFDGAASDFYKCGEWDRYTDVELDAELKYAKNNGGATVLRSWAFQSYTNSGTDWTGIDKLIRIAKDNGFKLILSLENGPEHCQLGNNNEAKWQYQGDTWYTDGYKQKYGSNQKTFYEYIDSIVQRYKDEPTIMAWELVNEPDTNRRTDGSTSCSNGTQTVLKAFAEDLSGRIRAIDSNHLITLGAQSNGSCGASGPDFVDVNSLDNIDFGTIHDYGYWADTNHVDISYGEQLALPGSTNGTTLPPIDSEECKQVYGARLACSIAYTRQVVNKPIVIEEAGISTSRFTLSQRADLFEQKIKSAFINGVSGYLVWQLNKVIDTDEYDVLTSTNDPIFAVMKKICNFCN